MMFRLLEVPLALRSAAATLLLLACLPLRAAEPITLTLNYYSFAWVNDPFTMGDKRLQYVQMLNGQQDGSWGIGVYLTLAPDRTIRGGTFSVGNDAGDLFGSITAKRLPNGDDILTYQVDLGSGAYHGWTGGGQSTFQLGFNRDSYFDFFEVGTLNLSPVPEPATWSMALAGAGLLAWRLRAARKTAKASESRVGGELPGLGQSAC